MTLIVAGVAVIIILLAALVALVGTQMVTDALSDNNGELPWWLQRLKDEPALLRSAIAQVVALLAIVGFMPDPAVIVTIEGMVAGLTAFWIRSAVTPASKLERQGYVYDKVAGRWRDADGRFASPPRA